MPRPLQNVIGDRFGDKLQLEIINKIPKTNNYRVKCHICAADPELYGEAYFQSQLNHLRSGTMPCGCSARPILSPEQHVVRCTRKCIKNNFEFIDFSGEWLGVDTKVRVRCIKDGHEWLITIDNLMRDKGCPKCRGNKASVSFRKEDDELIKQFIANGDFVEGTTFRRSDRKDSRGYKLWWEVFCPICSVDEYVLNGVCSGVFTAAHGGLNAGNKSCRCSKSYQWTREQRKYQIDKRFKYTSIKFNKWLTKDRVELVCSEHGSWNVSVTSLINSGSTCSGCCVSGFKRVEPACIYVFKILGSLEFTGYGISGKIDQRITNHKRNLRNKGCVIDEMEVFYTTGFAAQEIEKLIKINFDKHSQDIEGFKTEATYVYNYLDVVYFIESKLEEMEADLTNNKE